jgi:hypothetical protein
MPQIMSLFGFALLTTAITNCSMGSDVKDTKEVSGRIENQSKQIVFGTNDIKMSGRKDISTERVIERFHDLQKASSDAERLSLATVLCSTFEFQQWVGRFEDDLTLKDRFHEKAIRIFTSQIVLPLLGRDIDLTTQITGPLDVTGYGSGFLTSTWRELAAVGVAMSEIDSDQAEACKANGVEPESIYSLVIKGLEFKDQRNRGETIPKYASRVLAFETELVTVLQMRHNFLMGMVMSQFSEFTKTPLQEAMGVLNGVDLKLGNKNLAQIEDNGLQWMTDALQTQADLTRLHYPLEFNPYLGAAFAAARFALPHEVTISSAELKSFEEFVSKAKQLQNAYNSQHPGFFHRLWRQIH